MKNCNFCGEPLGEGKFCGKCGQAQGCLTCGTEYKADETFCTSCGAPRGAAGNQPVQPTAPVQPSAPAQPTASQQSSFGQPNVPNQPVNPGYQTAPGQPAPNKSFDFKKIPWFVWGAAAAAVVIIVYLNFFSHPSTPEKVVEEFFSAIEKRDESKVKKLVHPSVHSEIDLFDVPRDAKVRIVRFDEVEIEGNEAFVDVTIRIESQSEGLYDSEWFYVWLEKIDGKWIIYDMY